MERLQDSNPLTPSSKQLSAGNAFSFGTLLSPLFYKALPRESQEYFELPYCGLLGHTVRAKLRELGPSTRKTVGTFALSSVVFLCAISFLPSIVPGVGNDAVKICALIISLLDLSLVGAYLLYFMTDDLLLVDQVGIVLPKVYPANMSNARVSCFWAELESVAIVDQPRRGKHHFELVLSGKSKRICRINIAGMQPEGLDMLAGEIERRAPFCRNISQLSELKRFRLFELGELTGVSYLQLWESLTDKKIELTGFSPLRPGQKLQDGRLSVIRQLSSGGFSAVYLVEDPDGSKFVLKEAILPYGVDQELAQKAGEQFEREARILQTLNHPQIAKVYDFFTEFKRNYLLLDYVSGRTVREIIYDNGPQPDTTVFSWAIQLAGILNYLHDREHPIIHRDIAPDNLILSERGRLFLVDFGSANEFVGNATGTLVGKHAYMAPEQIRGKASPISDLYSFGQTIFFCLEGTAPTPLMSSCLTNPRSEVAKGLDKVIQTCTDLDANRRPRSAMEIVESLERRQKKGLLV